MNVLSETAIEIKWVKQILKESLSRKKLLIIDACHSGFGKGRTQALPTSRSFHNEVFSEAKGLTIMCSYKIDQLSYDYPEKDHGIFSYYLSEGLKD